jgi:predicted DNA-binding transcriptional regulator AlpA
MNTNENSTSTVDWSIEIEAHVTRPFDEDFADKVIEALADHSPAVAQGRDYLTVRFDVQAANGREAFEAGMEAVRRALPDLTPVRVVIETVDELERRLAQSNAPELLGVAELAEALGVSRQRVYELTEGQDFPAPFVHLKAGPVWQRSALARFMSSWKRRPGRPRVTTKSE